jgi:hypothetical protein
MIEPDTVELCNLNRNMLPCRSDCELPKAQRLAERLGDGLRFEPLLSRYDPTLLQRVAPLAPTVIVGVDHIPTRWAVQQANPNWLVVGATSHWSAMASFHSEGLACAHGPHHRDDPGDDIVPTTACVSFWAGLLSATYLVRHAAGQDISTKEQQVYLTPFRPDGMFSSAVAMREGCPTCQRASVRSSGSAASKQNGRIFRSGRSEFPIRRCAYQLAF